MTSSNSTPVSYSPADRRAEMTRIVQHTREMRARVDLGVWEDIVAMEAQRQEMLQSFFAQEPERSEAQWIAQAIQDMLELNRQMEELCRAHLQSVAKDLRQMNAGRKANEAYQSNSG